jgi:hypothetical protein
MPGGVGHAYAGLRPTHARLRITFTRLVSLAVCASLNARPPAAVGARVSDRGGCLPMRKWGREVAAWGP